jgi:hypothetical protein
VAVVEIESNGMSGAVAGAGSEHGWKSPTCHILADPLLERSLRFRHVKKSSGSIVRLRREASRGYARRCFSTGPRALFGSS